MIFFRYIYRHRKKALACLFVILLLDLSYIKYIHFNSTRLLKTESYTQFDYIVVFHGTSNSERCFPETIRRLNYAVTLLNSNKKASILCSGGGRKGVSGAEIMAKYLISRNIDKTKILIESQSYDTISNIDNSLNLLAKKHLRNIAFVSSPWHLYRISKILTRLDMSSWKISLLPYSIENTRPKLNPFEFYRQLQYEVVSNLLSILPQSMYSSLAKTKQFIGQYIYEAI